jgi:hypothetical protein
MFDLNADGLDRTVSVAIVAAVAILVGLAHQAALLLAERHVPREVERRKRAVQRLAERRERINPMIWAVLTLAAVTGACSASPTTPSAVQSSSVGSSNERVTTLSTRDSPLSHNDMPSAPVGDLVLNPDRSGNVLVKGRPPTDKATLTGYQVITWRDDPLKPGSYSLDRKVWHITVIDQDTVGPFKEGGSYKGEVRPIYLNRILGPAAVAYFSIDAVTSSPSSGPSGQCAEVPTASPCVREG